MRLRFSSWCATWISCAGMLLPVSWVRAEAPAAPPTGKADAAKAMVTDVSLQDGGKLCGVVVDAQGMPMVATDVTISQSGKAVARTKTDALGQFSAGALRGGVYQVAAGKGVTTLRAWEAGAAPPTARSVALITGSNTVVRGQRPFGSLVFSDGLILAAIIAAAIAIPIAVSNSGKSQPSSS